MNKCEKSKDGEHRWTEYTSGWACMFCMEAMPETTKPFGREPLCRNCGLPQNVKCDDYEVTVVRRES